MNFENVKNFEQMLEEFTEIIINYGKFTQILG